MTAGPDMQLAVVGNCEVAALIDTRASIVWACLPRPDGDPVFSALLSKEGGAAACGVFAFDMIDWVASHQQYHRNTAILETLLHDSRGNVVRVIDFCPRFRARGRMFRPATFVRMLEPVTGRPVVRIRIEPTTEFGAGRARKTSGSHHIRFCGQDLQFRLTTNASITSLLDAQAAVIDTPLAFILGPDETVAEAPLGLARSWLEQTRDYWQDWIRGLAVPFDWQEAVIRAAITLKLCTYEDTGAVLAALTTSIPEVADSGRNWDYRYCWLRDSYFVVHALNRLGATRTMEGYLRYIDHVVAGSPAGRLQPLYAISGNAQVAERVVDSLSGYRGMGPVRVGNLAYEQAQHDVYGAVILAAQQTFFDQRLASPGDRALFARLEVLGERAAAVYEMPDAGPWEFRGRERVHTFSAVMCWAACDRLARIAQQLDLGERAAFWRGRAAKIHERIHTRAWNSTRQAYTSGFDSDDLDATALLLPELGFLSPADPRFLSTLAAIERELRHGDLMFRYRHADDLGLPANTFTMCSFWYVNALAAVGRLDEAREHFNVLLGRRNHVGLLSEDIDPRTGEQWGNFPQTYSMVGIITSARRLSRPWEDML